MLSWLMDSRVIGTIGLCLDIIGAILVAVEVVKIYKGNITSAVNGAWNDRGKPTIEYHMYEKERRKWMKIGLACLLFGFGLQILALWM
jgi:hypothetical protein